MLLGERLLPLAVGRLCRCRSQADPAARLLGVNILKNKSKCLTSNRGEQNVIEKVNYYGKHLHFTEKAANSPISVYFSTKRQTWTK